MMVLEELFDVSSSVVERRLVLQHDVRVAKAFRKIERLPRCWLWPATEWRFV